MPSPPDDTPSIPPPWRWTLRIAKSLLLLLLMLAAIRWAWGRYADAKYEQAINQTRRPNEPFDAEDFKQPQIPDSENAVNILKSATDSLSSEPGTLPDPFEFETANGTDNAIAHLWLNSNRTVLAKLRSAKSKPIDWKFDFSYGSDNFFRTTSSMERQLADLTLLAAKASHFNQDDTETIEYWSDLLTEAKIIRQQPARVSYVDAANIDEKACFEILNRAPELRLQPSNTNQRTAVNALIAQLLDDQDLSNARVRLIYTSRLFDMQTWRQAMNGNLDAFNVYGSHLGPSFWERAIAFAIKPSLKLKAARNLRDYDAALKALSAADFKTAMAIQPRWKPPMESTLFIADHTEALGDLASDWSQFIQLEFQLRLERRAAAMSLAIRLYRADHDDALPPDAAALVPRYLPSLPLDPFDSSGHSIRYAPKALARPILYSLGPKGVDLANTGWSLPAKRAESSWRDQYYFFELAPPSSPK